jgi:hypothetical protein
MKERRKGQKDAARRCDVLERAAQHSQITAYDRAVTAGVLGAILGTPPDLSTNPKYMDGFGNSPPE